MSISITIQAADKKAGMTLGDLRDVIRQAEQAGLSDDAKLVTVTGFRSQLQKVEVRSE